MNANVTPGNILSFQALAMNKKLFDQVETKPYHRPGEPAQWDKTDLVNSLIGYVRTEYGVWFVGENKDKLFRVREENMMDYLMYHLPHEPAGSYSFEMAERKVKNMIAGLSQIFLK